MKKLQILSVFLLIASLAVLCRCSTHEETRSVRLLHTTDVHGNLFGYDFITQQELPSGLARVSTYVKQARQECKDLLLLDGGDILQGSPAVYYSNYVESPIKNPHIASDVMNDLLYNVAVVGNHDMEATPTVYRRWEANLNCPLLAANVLYNEGYEAYGEAFSSYSTHLFGDFKLVVLGLITPAVPDWLPESSYEGMHFEDPIATARDLLRKIEEKEKPDVVVALVHSGYEGNGAENFVKELATSVSGIDVIFFGHDHRSRQETLQAPDGREVLVINPGSHARQIADVSLEVTERRKTFFGLFSTKKVSAKIGSAALVSLADVPADTAFLKKYAPYMDQVRDYVSMPVAHLSTPLVGIDALFGPSAYMTLLHQVQMDLSGAQVSLSAPHNVALDMSEGMLRTRDFFDLYPFENHLCKLKLTGQEIRDFLEYSYGLWCGEEGDPQGAHVLALRSVHEGDRFFTKAPTYNFSSAGGINYTVDYTKPRGQKVAISSLYDGSPFSLSATYTVAVNSYRANGGGGHFFKGCGLTREELKERVVWSSVRDLRYDMIDWALQRKTIAVPSVANWSFVPADRAVKAIARDRAFVDQYVSR